MRFRFQNDREWHVWFAWHPVVIGHQTIWLEHVERRLPPHDWWCVWEYRLRNAQAGYSDA